MKKIIIIHCDWNNAKSIAYAERRKAAIENKGYRLTAERSSLFRSTLIYEK